MAVENMTDALIVIDAANRIVDFNPPARQLLAGGQAELIGRRLAEVSAVGMQLAQVVDGGAAMPLQLSLNNYDYDLRLSPLLNRHNLALGSLISLRDITPLKRTEQLLASRNRVLETLNQLSTELSATLALKPVLETTLRTVTQLLDVTSAAICEWDETLGSLTVVAEHFSAAASAQERVSRLGFSYHWQQDLGRSPGWLLAPNYNYVVQAAASDTAAGEKALLTRYGVQTVFRAPLLAKGKLIGTLTLWESRQVREFDRNESTLILSIAGQVAIAMENARLYERSVAANQVKSQILRQVNHELRTPLSVVMLYTTMLANGVYGDLNEKQAAANDKVVRNAQQLRSLVTQLLAQAELASHKVVLSSEPFAPVELLEQVATQMKPLAEAKGLAFALVHGEKVPATLLGDPLRIQQIVINLVSNAIKYTTAGQVIIQTTIDGEERWSIVVRDTGSGIAAADLDHIFEPFWQAEDGARTNVSGVGLGLSIVQQFVNLMQGEITVANDPGQGVAFTVTLPLRLP